MYQAWLLVARSDFVEKFAKISSTSKTILKVSKATENKLPKCFICQKTHTDNVRGLCQGLDNPKIYVCYGCKGIRFWFRRRKQKIFITRCCHKWAHNSKKVNGYEVCGFNHDSSSCGKATLCIRCREIDTMNYGLCWNCHDYFDRVGWSKFVILEKALGVQLSI